VRLVGAGADRLGEDVSVFREDGTQQPHGVEQGRLRRLLWRTTACHHAGL
jgi:hypothetical protein